MDPAKNNPSPAIRYGAAVACVAAALLIRVALNPSLGAHYPFFTVVIAVFIAARFWGTGPAIVATLLGHGVGIFVIGYPGEPARNFFPAGVASATLVCAIAIWVLSVQRRAYADAARSAQISDIRLAELREHAAEMERQQKLSAQLTAIVESSEDAIISKDLEGNVQSWNYGAEQIFGYTAAEIVGQPISRLLPAGRTHEESDIMERIRHGGRVKHFETVRARKDGKEIHVSLTISPIRDATGAVVGGSQIARDITEQKELEHQLRQTQKLESLGVLAGGLAHDFNNLLTGIVGNASLADMDPALPEVARGRIQEVLAASDRAAMLVRQMLAYAGKGRFVIEPVDLSQQVSEIIALLRNSVPKTVTFDLNLEPQLPKVECDRSQLQQVIMNLAINAAEAVGDAPGVVTISTRAGESNGEPQVTVEVRDTGCGMDAETKSRIFDPFFTTKFTGRGLGLAAVTGIIRSHRGSISVESTPGQGSTFTVIFPAGGNASPAPAPEQEIELRGFGRILVVDDEELIRNMAKFTLEHCGYTVDLAPDGRHAVAAFRTDPHSFDAILLDLTMPVMSGEEALRHLRHLRPDVPIVLSSGFSETEALRRFQAAGLAGFLQKPYTATALARRIKQAVKKS